MENLKKNIDSLGQKVNKLEKNIDGRIVILEEFMRKEEKDKIKEKYELKEMITDAVKNGNYPILEKLSTLESRVSSIEDAEKEKAWKEKQEREHNMKEDKRTFRRQFGMVAISVIVTFFLSMSLNYFFTNKTSDEKIDKLTTELEIYKKDIQTKND